MSTLDEITAEKERLDGEITRIRTANDTKIAFYTNQRDELETAERVLKRLDGSPKPAKQHDARVERAISLGLAVRTNGAQKPTRSRGRPRKPVAVEQTAPAPKTAAADSAPKLGDRVLAAVTPQGTTKDALMVSLKDARPNHIGIAIQRHIRGGRLLERDGVLYRQNA